MTYVGLDDRTVGVQSAPDASSSLGRALDIAALEGFYFCARRVEKQFYFLVDVAESEAV